jgi:hypothetical protein
VPTGQICEVAIGATSRLYVSPEEAIQAFHDHLNTLLRDTITSITLRQTRTPDGAIFQFPDKRCVPLSDGFHLYVGQTVAVVKEKYRDRTKKERTGYRVRTLAYQYRLSEGQSLDDPYVIRWEYNAREHQTGTFPRHHVHIPVALHCFQEPNTRELNLKQLHVSTGYVTLEEVIRFLLSELGLRARNRRWDNLLRKSERQFRVWTRRSV